MEISVVVARGADGGVFGVRYGGEPPSRPHPRPHPGAGAHPGSGAPAGAGDRAAGRRCAGPGRAAGGGDVRRCAMARCWSTRSRRGRIIPAIGLSMRVPPASSSCISGPLPGLPLPPAVRHSDAVMKNLVGPGRDRPVADDTGNAGVDPAPLRQDGGPARAQDGARHATVPQGVAAGRVRDCRGVGRATGGPASATLTRHIAVGGTNVRRGRKAAGARGREGRRAGDRRYPSLLVRRDRTATLTTGCWPVRVVATIASR